MKTFLAFLAGAVVTGGLFYLSPTLRIAAFGRSISLEDIRGKK